MNSPPATRQRLLKLGLLALFCALPFLLALVYLERQVDRIDTLPVDEYKGLTWSADGRTLLFLHRPLVPGAPTELWSSEASTLGFSSLGHLSAERVWRLTEQSVDGLTVLASTEAGIEGLWLFENGATKPVNVDPRWNLLASQGAGLFYSKVVDDVPFEQMVEVEDAPEVSRPLQHEYEEEEAPEPSASPDVPLRSGLQIGRYNKSTGAPDVLLTVPFNGPAEQPRVVLVRESPDHRFLALVTRFGEAGAAGLWVYDSEASRLLWTRVITDPEVSGIDWSPASVALALCDGQGVVILDNVLNIESTRYQAHGLGDLDPLFVEEDALYLVGEASLHRLDRQNGEAEVIFDSHSKGVDAMSFVVNPGATRAAFFSSPQGYLELHIYDLTEKDAAPTVTNLPGSLRRLAQSTLSYQIGDALRIARKFWMP